MICVSPACTATVLSAVVDTCPPGSPSLDIFLLPIPQEQQPGGSSRRNPRLCPFSGSFWPLQYSTDVQTQTKGGGKALLKQQRPHVPRALSRSHPTCTYGAAFSPAEQAEGAAAQWGKNRNIHWFLSGCTESNLTHPQVWWLWASPCSLPLCLPVALCLLTFCLLPAMFLTIQINLLVIVAIPQHYLKGSHRFWRNIVDNWTQQPRKSTPPLSALLGGQPPPPKFMDAHCRSKSIL